ncbi:hypothetical protein AIIKEEIJ_02141 [Rhodococcus sp. YH1]|nr:hypothetical protein [Rhodococcus sp. YH1]
MGPGARRVRGADAARPGDRPAPRRRGRRPRAAAARRRPHGRDRLGRSPARRHRQHPRPGGVGRAARPVDRTRRRRLRRHRVGPAGGPARRGVDGGPVHQHPAGAGDVRSAGADRAVPAAPATGAGRVARASSSGSHRDPAGRRADRGVRHPHGVRVLPARREGPGRPGGVDRRHVGHRRRHERRHPLPAEPVHPCRIRHGTRPALPAQAVRRAAGRDAAVAVRAGPRSDRTAAGAARRRRRSARRGRTRADPARVERLGPRPRRHRTAPVPVRGAGPAHPGCGGAGLRGCRADVRRIRRPRQSPRAAPDLAGGGAGVPGGPGDPAVVRPAGGHVRDRRGRRRMGADRSGSPGRPCPAHPRHGRPGVHRHDRPRRVHRSRRAHRRRRPRRRAGSVGGLGRARHRPGPACAAAPGQHGLRHLHVRLDRPAQGRRRHAPRHRQPDGVDARRVRDDGTGRLPAEDGHDVRRVAVGLLHAAERGGEAGRGDTRRPPRPGVRRGRHRPREGDDHRLRAVDAHGVRRPRRPGVVCHAAAHLRDRRGPAAGDDRGRAAHQHGRDRQPLRPDRSGGVGHLLAGAGHRTGRRGADRRPGVERAGAGPRRPAAAGAGRGPG